MPVEFVAGLVVAVWGLTSGATVCMFDPRRHPIADLVGWIADARLSTLHATPTLLRAILRSVDPAQRYPDLRLVTTCGEPVTAADVRALGDHVSSECEFVNWTGSSEVGVLALRRVNLGDRSPTGRFPPAAWSRVSRSRSRRSRTVWTARSGARTPRTPEPSASSSSPQRTSPSATAETTRTSTAAFRRRRPAPLPDRRSRDARPVRRTAPARAPGYGTQDRRLPGRAERGRGRAPRHR